MSVKTAWPQIVGQAWADDTFRQRLIADPRTTLAECGVALEEGHDIEILTDTPEKTYLVIPAKPADLDDLAGTAVYTVYGQCTAFEFEIGTCTCAEYAPGQCTGEHHRHHHHHHHHRHHHHHEHEGQCTGELPDMMPGTCTCADYQEPGTCTCAGYEEPGTCTCAGRPDLEPGTCTCHFHEDIEPGTCTCAGHPGEEEPGTCTCAGRRKD